MSKRIQIIRETGFVHNTCIQRENYTASGGTFCKSVWYAKTHYQTIPWLTTLSTGALAECAIKPKMAKITNPAKILVAQLIMGTSIASLKFEKRFITIH